jgi:hypothetical protein
MIVQHLYSKQATAFVLLYFLQYFFVAVESRILHQARHFSLRLNFPFPLLLRLCHVVGLVLSGAVVLGYGGLAKAKADHDAGLGEKKSIYDLTPEEQAELKNEIKGVADASTEALGTTIRSVKKITIKIHLH